MKRSVAVIIRKANKNDIDFVSSLMSRTLDSFYDGDHQAHAQRIFAAHANDNIEDRKSTRLNSSH